MPGTVSALNNDSANLAKFYVESNSAKNTIYAQQLSSGSRIPNPSFDPASAAVADGIRSRLSLTAQGIRTVNQMSSLFEMVSNSLASTNRIINRLQVLSGQSASDTIDDTQRAMLQKEVTKLTSQIDNNAKGTIWGNTVILAGGVGTSTNSGAVTQGVSATTAVANGLAAGLTAGQGFITGVVNDVSVTKTGAVFDVRVKIGNQWFGNKNVVAPAIGAALTLVGDKDTNNQVTFSYDGTAVTAFDGTAATFKSNLKTFFGITGGSVSQFASGSIAMYTGATISPSSSTTAGDWGLSYTVSGTKGTFKLSNGNEIYTQDITAGNPLSGSVTFSNGLKLGLSSFNGSATLAQSTFVVAPSATQLSLSFQLNQSTTSVGFSDATATGLNINGIDISTSANAISTQGQLNAALSVVSNMIADIGGVRSQADYTLENLKSTNISQQVALDTFESANIAEAMINASKFKTLGDMATHELVVSIRDGMKIAEMVKSVQ